MSLPPIGVFLRNGFAADHPVPDTTAQARQAETLGFDSVWVTDSIAVGTGAGVLNSTLVLAAAAAATQRVKLGFSVMILPLRAPAWAAKDIATLQHLSGDRVILGVGSGNTAHTTSWDLLGIPSKDRGALLDAALAVLPDLIAGNAVNGLKLNPGATVPPILAGGMAKASIRRAKAFDGWVPPRLTPDQTRDAIAEHGLEITTNLICVGLAGDPTLGSREDLVAALMNPVGLTALPREVAEMMAVYGTVEEIAALLKAHGEAGPVRIVVQFPAGDWMRQAELLAEAVKLARNEAAPSQTPVRP